MTQGIKSVIVGLGLMLGFTVGAAAQPVDHSDTRIDYLACDGSKNPGVKWSAKWQGNDFYHWPGAGTNGRAHPDSIINYVTWDGGCWTASWDSTTSQYIHHPYGQPGNSHPDTVLNYQGWDHVLWSAVRDGDLFQHFYVGPAAAGPPTHFTDQVHTFIDRNHNTIKITNRDRSREAAILSRVEQARGEAKESL